MRILTLFLFAASLFARAESLNYPYVRFASNRARIYNSANEFISDNYDYAVRLAPQRLGTNESYPRRTR
jgi:hypothetical protein